MKNCENNTMQDIGFVSNPHPLHALLCSLHAAAWYTLALVPFLMNSTDIRLNSVTTEKEGTFNY